MVLVSAFVRVDIIMIMEFVKLENNAQHIVLEMLLESVSVIQDILFMEIIALNAPLDKFGLHLRIDVSSHVVLMRN